MGDGAEVGWGRFFKKKCKGFAHAQALWNSASGILGAVVLHLKAPFWEYATQFILLNYYGLSLTMRRPDSIKEFPLKLNELKTDKKR